MPYELRKQGDKYCVINKETGDNKGCSDTPEMARKHMRALYANEKKQIEADEQLVDFIQEIDETVHDEPLVDRLKKFVGLGEPQVITLIKQEDGRLRVMMRVSNMFKDRHGEIITQEAHRAYASYLDKNPEEMPEFWVWHTPGSRWGQADFVDFSDGFLSASGLVDIGQEEVAVAIARKDFGVSHGFRAISLNHNNFIDAYKSFEFSPLPRDQAANLITGVMMLGERSMDVGKRQKLLDIGIPEATVTRWESDSKDTTEILKELGIEYKTEPTPEPDPEPAKPETTLSDVLGQITRIANRLEAVETKQKEYTDDLSERMDKAVESVLSAAITPGADLKGHVASKSNDNEPPEELKRTQDQWQDELKDLLVGSGK